MLKMCSQKHFKLFCFLILLMIIDLIGNSKSSSLEEDLNYGEEVISATVDEEVGTPKILGEIEFDVEVEERLPNEGEAAPEVVVVGENDSSLDINDYNIEILTELPVDLIQSPKMIGNIELDLEIADNSKTKTKDVFIFPENSESVQSKNLNSKNLSRSIDNSDNSERVHISEDRLFANNTTISTNTTDSTISTNTTDSIISTNTTDSIISTNTTDSIISTNTTDSTISTNTTDSIISTNTIDSKNIKYSMNITTDIMDTTATNATESVSTVNPIQDTNETNDTTIWTDTNNLTQSISVGSTTDVVTETVKTESISSTIKSDTITSNTPFVPIDSTSPIDLMSTKKPKTNSNVFPYVLVGIVFIFSVILGLIWGFTKFFEIKKSESEEEKRISEAAQKIAKPDVAAPVAKPTVVVAPVAKSESADDKPLPQQPISPKKTIENKSIKSNEEIDNKVTKQTSDLKMSAESNTPTPAVSDESIGKTTTATQEVQTASESGQSSSPVAPLKHTFNANGVGTDTQESNSLDNSPNESEKNRSNASSTSSSEKTEKSEVLSKQSNDLSGSSKSAKTNQSLASDSKSPKSD